MHAPVPVPIMKSSTAEPVLLDRLRLQVLFIHRLRLLFI